MVPATLNTVSVDLAAGSEHSFRASGTTVIDPGFLAVYEEGKDSKTAEDEDEGRKLPLMKPGDRVPLDRIHTDQHFTEPPPRFSEASLVKALEEYGIGRPSTYASIIQTLLFRKYAELENRRFRPSDVGRAVVELPQRPFHPLRRLRLHREARGRARCGIARRGGVGAADGEVLGPVQGAGRREDRIGRPQPRPPARANSAPIPKTGKPVSVRLGRYGPYAAIGSTAEDEEEKPTFASLRPGQSMHTISLEEALELFRCRASSGANNDEEVSVGIGRFGPFAKRGSVYASLKKEDDPYTIDLARAVFLIDEKEEIARNRIIKAFDGSDIQVLNGRYGPYISDGKLNGAHSEGSRTGIADARRSRQADGGNRQADAAWQVRRQEDRGEEDDCAREEGDGDEERRRRRLRRRRQRRPRARPPAKRRRRRPPARRQRKKPPLPPPDPMAACNPPARSLERSRCPYAVT